MTDLLGMGIAMLVGALLGVFFFGGLWWTIQKGMASNWAALWFIGSLLLRTTAVMAGFYFVSQHHWSRFVAFVVGFLLARLVTVKWLGTAKRCPVPFLRSTRRASSPQKVPDTFFAKEKAESS